MDLEEIPVFLYLRRLLTHSLATTTSKRPTKLQKITIPDESIKGLVDFYGWTEEWGRGYPR